MDGLDRRGPFAVYLVARLAALAARFSFMVLAGAFLTAFMLRCSLAMGGSLVRGESAIVGMRIIFQMLNANGLPQSDQLRMFW
jgi:hypothetical protein